VKRFIASLRSGLLKTFYRLVAHGLRILHGFLGAQGFLAAHGFIVAQGLNFFCKTEVYAVNAASCLESQAKGLLCMGLIMHSCTMPSSVMESIPATSFAICT
jgi:hypothetical protein